MGWLASLAAKAASGVGTAATAAAPAAAEVAKTAGQAVQKAGPAAAKAVPQATAQIGHLGGQMAQTGMQANARLMNAIGSPAGNSLLSGQGPMQTMHRGMDIGNTQVAPGVTTPTNVVPQMPGEAAAAQMPGAGPVNQMPMNPGASPMAEAESFWGKTWEFLKTDTGIAMADMVGGFRVDNPPPSYGPMSYNQSRAQPNVGPGLIGLGQLSSSY